MEKTLLRKIQDAATDPDADVPSLLRLCKILASRLDNGTLSTWVDAELSGYADDAELPDYRVFGASSTMQAFNQFRGKAQLPVSTSQIFAALQDEDEAASVYTIRMREGVAKVAHLLNGKSPTRMWPDDVVRKVAPFVTEWDAVNAWNVIDSSHLIGILDAVKTRALNLVLDLETENPQLGEQAPSGLPGPDEQRVNQIVTNHITVTGNYANINASVTKTDVVAGDLASLQAALAAAGLSGDEVKDVARIVQEEKSAPSVMEKIKGFSEKLALKAAETGVVELVKGFFG